MWTLIFNLLCVECHINLCIVLFIIYLHTNTQNTLQMHTHVLIMDNHCIHCQGFYDSSLIVSTLDPQLNFVQTMQLHPNTTCWHSGDSPTGISSQMRRQVEKKQFRKRGGWLEPAKKKRMVIQIRFKNYLEIVF